MGSTQSPQLEDNDQDNLQEDWQGCVSREQASEGDPVGASSCQAVVFSVCRCLCVCVRACVRECVRACVRACLVRLCVLVWFVCLNLLFVCLIGSLFTCFCLLAVFVCLLFWFLFVFCCLFCCACHFGLLLCSCFVSCVFCQSKNRNNQNKTTITTITTKTKQNNNQNKTTITTNRLVVILFCLCACCFGSLAVLVVIGLFSVIFVIFCRLLLVVFAVVCLFFIFWGVLSTW